MPAAASTRGEAVVTDDGWILPDKDGGFSVSFKVNTEPGVIARWEPKTNEMTLERAEDNVVILATRNPNAFVAGVELLRNGRMVTWLGFVLTKRRLDCVMRQVP